MLADFFVDRLKGQMQSQEGQLFFVAANNPTNQRAFVGRIASPYLDQVEEVVKLAAKPGYTIFANELPRLVLVPSLFTVRNSEIQGLDQFTDGDYRSDSLVLVIGNRNILRYEGEDLTFGRHIRDFRWYCRVNNFGTS